MIVCDIKKQLRDFELDINFHLNNETLVIVGKSGCGKSTTLKALGGLLSPDNGRIQIGDDTYFDNDLRINISPEDRGIGFLFQNYALFPHLTVYENVGYGLVIRKIPKKVQRRKVFETLELLNVSHLIDNMPADLSGGEQQRVALARALILQPKVLLLDEPLSALDVTTRGRVRRELKKMLSTLNIPTIIVTHDYEDAISLGDRILVMDKGRVIQEGTSEELLIHPRSSFVADFSGTNYFTAQAVGTKQDYLCLHTTEWNVTLMSTQLNKGSTSEEYPGHEKSKKEASVETDLSVMIHPWNIKLAKEMPGDIQENIIPGTVMNILSYGNRARVEMEGSIPLTIEVSSTVLQSLGLVEGGSIYAVIDPSAVHVLYHREQSAG